MHIFIAMTRHCNRRLLYWNDILEPGALMQYLSFLLEYHGLFLKDPQQIILLVLIKEFQRNSLENLFKYNQHIPRTCSKLNKKL